MIFVWFFDIGALSEVNLIQEASWAIILSDLKTDASRRPGLLWIVLAGLGHTDRDPSGAMPPIPLYSGDEICKSFSNESAHVFTTGCGELPRALLASAIFMVGTVSGHTLWRGSGPA